MPYSYKQAQVWIEYVSSCSSLSTTADIKFSDTFCKLCRRPVGQATRYGEWYTGNDTDLDEQLLEYNAEQARAASEAGIQLERRKSDLASYTADKDDADFTDEENAEAAHKSSSRLRRSTIAPGQVWFDFLLLCANLILVTHIQHTSIH